jgi:hypothetical protein
MRARLLVASLLTACTTVAVACGGKVVVDASAGGAPAGTGGSVGATPAMTATTASSTSSSAGGPCEQGTCPGTRPGSGAACDCPNLVCTYDECPVDGPYEVATCAGTNGWAVSVLPCSTVMVPCGGTTCPPGAVCVTEISGFGMPPSYCVEDPCGSAPLDCSCALSACPAAVGFTCSVADGGITCTCDDC